jgi:hypothetical protein
MLVLYLRYRNVSKTDVRASLIQHPKSAPPKTTQTMEELFPAPPKLANYRYMLFCYESVRLYRLYCKCKEQLHCKPSL